MSIIDLAWLAGLLEGEGCFTAGGTGVRVELSMTDKDIVQKAAALCKRPLRGPYSVNGQEGKKHWKDQWRFTAHGNQAAQWMMTLYPFLGLRRQETIRKELKRWLRTKNKRMIGLPNDCEHKIRKHYAFGLCECCYKKAKRKEINLEIIAT